MVQAPEADNEFVIRAASTLADHRTQVLKHGETFGVFDRTGDIDPHGLGEHGVYHDGTRYLSRLALRVEDQRPLLLGTSITQDNVALLVDLTNAEIGGRGPLAQYSVHLVRERLLWDATCFERLEVMNHCHEPIQLRLSYDFAADFRDIFEVRGMHRQRRGRTHPPHAEADCVAIAYDGLDGCTRTTRIQFEPRPAALSATRATFEVRLAPDERCLIAMTVLCENDGPAPSPPARVDFQQAEQLAVAEVEAGLADACSIETSNSVFNDWLERASADLHMMTTATDSGPFIYAGVPWFSAPFGRDAIITALETLTVRPSLAAGVLRYLAATQASDYDAARDAQPGKILHEARGGEMAARGEIPFGRYYGSVDSTPLFVMLAGAYYQRTGDRALIDELWPHIERALAWIDDSGDPDGDGFVEYRCDSEQGLTHQGWKDSPDPISHADGTLARGPIALCEVQGYTYAAWLAAAALAARRGDPGRAHELQRRAVRLRRRFDGAFWQPDIETYALALDGDKRACVVRASNAGHALFSGIAPRRRASALARSLFAAGSFSGWGIRTLDARETRYNPMSYHNGSVWPHDNALIARGLAFYGRKTEALAITSAMFDSAQWFEERRMPELFCGLQRRTGRGPTLYPVACSPQSWAAGAVFMLLDACLGIEIDGAQRTLRLVQPQLPPFIDQLSMRRLRIGESMIDLRLRRHEEDVSVEVTRRRGDVSVTVVK